MAASRWHTISTALLTTMRAQPGYCAPDDWDGTAIPVLDGVEALLMEAGHVPAFLVIRWAGDEALPTDSGRAERRLATLGHVARDEDGVIACRVVVQDGDANTLGLATVSYDAAFAVLDTVGAVLLADPTLGVAAPRILVQLGRHDVRQYVGAGVSTEIDFVVTYSTRI